jgi:tetratricopeptide (TPR) repeat protein
VTIDPDLLFEHALRLYQQGNLADAERMFQDVSRSRPADFDTLYLLGVIAARSGRAERAAELIARAVAVDPNHAEARSNLACVLENLGRPEQALPHYDKAIQLDPGLADAHYNRGNVLLGLDRLDDALASYDTAIALRRDFADAHYNRGNALRELGHPEAALAAFDRAIALRPDHADAHNNRGNTLRDLDRHADALAAFQRAIALRPNDADVFWNESLCRLALGDYDTGWKLFEARWHIRSAQVGAALPGRHWTGDFPIEGKTILVSAEQGLGDTLQFCRYLPLLGARANVVLGVPRPLARLLSGLPGVSRVVATGDTLPPFDAWISMMSLPLAFRSTLATIPAAVPYLHADPEQVAFWRARLGSLPGRKVGLVWAGSPRPELPHARAIDRRRSITIGHYAPLADIPGISLISLQKGDAAAQARTPPTGMVLHDWTDELDDFADTAALVEALDLVISVDTSVVHLTGALGRPIWVLNRYDQCWRWLRDRTDSPWYPTARLFRQTTPGDWTDVIRDVADALRVWV